MRIPYVIDNQTHRMADVLNALLEGHAGKSLDVATAYFNIQGFRLLQFGMEQLGSFRLLLGDEPERGEQVRLKPKEPKIARGLGEILGKVLLIVGGPGALLLWLCVFKSQFLLARLVLGFLPLQSNLP